MPMTPDEIDRQVAVLGEIAAQMAELVSEVQQLMLEARALNEKFADFFVCQGQEVE